MKYLLFIFFISCTKLQPETPQIEQTFYGKDLEFFNAVNEMRLSRNIAVLKGNKQLTNGCIEHSKEMDSLNILGHFGFSKRANDSNAIRFSEVVAYGDISAQSFLSLYMNSENHRHVLIDSTKTDIGISTIGLYQTVNLGSYK